MTESVPSSASRPVFLSLVPRGNDDFERRAGAWGEIRFAPELSGDALAQAEAAAEVVFGGGHLRVSKALLDRMPNLRIIVSRGVGYDGYDLAELRRRGIRLTNTPDVLSEDAADYALTLLFALVRQVPLADRYVREGRWAKREPLPMGVRFFGKKLGIAGLGRIGRVCAERAAGIGLEVGYFDRQAKPGAPWPWFETLEALASWADFLILVLPGGESTRHAADAKVLKALGPQGWLVNIARGTVVDQAALLEVLEKKTIAGAALDVFENEPDPDPRFFTLPNVILSPHQAVHTNETVQAINDLAIENLERWMRGASLKTPVPGTDPSQPA